MYKGLKNRKGFTLIELLAAIVILGVLMMVAIPAMTRYIANSKKDVFMNTAKQYISSVRYAILSDGFLCEGSDSPFDCGLSDLTNSYTRIIVPASIVELDSSSGTNSPWGKPFATKENNNAWIIVYNNGSSEEPSYEYYFIGTDTAGNGFSDASLEANMKRSKVKTGGTIPTLDDVKKEFCSADEGGVTPTCYVVDSYN